MDRLASSRILSDIMHGTRSQHGLVRIYAYLKWSWSNRWYNVFSHLKDHGSNTVSLVLPIDLGDLLKGRGNDHVLGSSSTNRLINMIYIYNFWPKETIYNSSVTKQKKKNHNGHNACFWCLYAWIGKTKNTHILFDFLDNQYINHDWRNRILTNGTACCLSYKVI